LRIEGERGGEERGVGSGEWANGWKEAGKSWEGLERADARMRRMTRSRTIRRKC
jgi:hypothetical protein